MTERSVFHTLCTDGDGAFREHGGRGYEADPVCQRIDYRQYTGIYDRLDQRIGCI